MASHGISESTVRGKPSFLGVWQKVAELISAATVIHHGSFDRTAVSGACRSVGLAVDQSAWLDSTKAQCRANPFD